MSIGEYEKTKTFSTLIRNVENNEGQIQLRTRDHPSAILIYGNSCRLALEDVISTKTKREEKGSEGSLSSLCRNLGTAGNQS